MASSTMVVLRSVKAAVVRSSRTLPATIRDLVCKIFGHNYFMYANRVAKYREFNEQSVIFRCKRCNKEVKHDRVHRIDVPNRIASES